MASKTYTDLFVLMLDDKILTPDVFKQYWKNYGGNELYGWKPPKKVYYTIGAAKNGLRWVPEQIRDKVEIHTFRSCGKIGLDKQPSSC